MKINKNDFDKIAEQVCAEFEYRKQSPFRKEHESRWRETDRQKKIEPPESLEKSGSVDEDWHNAIELGLTSSAIEIGSADIMRIEFPNNRKWFDPHTGGDQESQKERDDEVRAFMSQQHIDFGLKPRFELSVKESLSHGSFVAFAEPKRLTQVEKGGKIFQLTAPVWKPHSMWHSYPDPSPEVMGTNLFYDGSMLVERYMKLRDMKNLGLNLKGLEEEEHKIGSVTFKGIHVLIWKGPISIERARQNQFVPNADVWVSNGKEKKTLKAVPNEFPFPNVMFGGYERQDVRDPYFTSPVHKNVPWHKLATRSANKFLDSVDLLTEPPVNYNENSPSSAGAPPDLSPGAKNPTSTLGEIEVLQIGNPQIALEGLRYATEQSERGVNIDATRSGVSQSTEQTKFEVQKKDSRAEVRTVDFLSKLEDNGLRPFLYMQHIWNKKNLERYNYYNPELGQEDFNVMTKAKLPEEATFDVVGGRKVLSEEQRQQGVLTGYQLFSVDEEASLILNKAEHVKEVYSTFGVENPERLLNIPTKDEEERFEEMLSVRTAQLEAAIQAGEQTSQELSQEIQKLNEELSNVTLQSQKQELQLEQKDLLLAEEKLKTQEQKTRAQSLQEELKQLNQQISFMEGFRGEMAKNKPEDPKDSQKPTTEKPTTVNIELNEASSKKFNVKRTDSGFEGEVNSQ